MVVKESKTVWAISFFPALDSSALFVLDITTPLEVTPMGNTEVDETLSFGIQGAYIPSRFDMDFLGWSDLWFIFFKLNKPFDTNFSMHYIAL